MSGPHALPGRPPTASERRALRAFASLLDGFEAGAVELVLPDGRRRTFGNDSADPVRFHLHDWRVPGALLRGASVGLGESYLNGWWSSPDLVGLLAAFVADRGALRSVVPGTVLAVALEHARHRTRSNRRAQARRNIAAHYDLSNEFYALFLDDSMTYSSAYFTAPGQSLEAAQEAKYRRLAEQARIDASHHVLEIGCGWGGFASYLAKTHGCRVTGITLSAAQADFARQRLAREGLDHLVDIQLVDYRDLGGRFDRIVSVEMLEAVGHRYLGTYFAAVDRLLGEHGLAAIQVITIPEQRYDAYRRRPDFLQRYIFPGGHVPSLAAMTAAVGDHSSLVVEDVHAIGPHYAETLRRWRERFLANRDGVHALGFDQRFVRMWEFYLAYCEAGFATRYINDLQLLLTRPMNPALGLGVPLQRASAAARLLTPVADGSPDQVAVDDHEHTA